MRVFVTHNPEDLGAYFTAALAELRSFAHQVVLNPLDRDLTNEELIQYADGCDVIIAHRSTPGEEEVFLGLPNLQAFLRTAVDVSTIDLDAADRHGVLIANADKSFVPSTAELALGLMIDSMRNIAESTVDYRSQSGVQPPQRPGRQLRGQTAGIIGFGSIGSYLADLLIAMGMRVLVYDPHHTVDPERFDQVPTLPELLVDSDVVFPLAVSTPETHHLIDAAAISSMKRGATLVNVSRGELVDEEAAAAALVSGQLRGLALDVGSAPDQRPSLELAGRAGVVATPHLGGLTPENADAQAMSAVDQVRELMAGSIPMRTLNAEHASRFLSRGEAG